MGFKEQGREPCGAAPHLCGYAWTLETAWGPCGKRKARLLLLHAASAHCTPFRHSALFDQLRRLKQARPISNDSTTTQKCAAGLLARDPTLRLVKCVLVPVRCLQGLTAGGDRRLAH